MISHIQRDFGEGTGDCFAVCIASILDLPLDDVPNFRRMQTEDNNTCMVHEADKWLREVHKKRFISIELYSQSGRVETGQIILNRLSDKRCEYVILSGLSPRANADGSEKHHCVIGLSTMWGYDVIHDPHPDGTGIVGQPYGVKWIVPVS